MRPLTQRQLSTLQQPITSRSATSASITAQQGFTLIEVMVALAILAMVAVAASQASGTYLRSVDHLKTRTLAHFVAQNTAAQLRINPNWPPTTQVNKVLAQGRGWLVSISPIPIDRALTSANSTYSVTNMQDSVRAVSIQVAPIDSQTNAVQHTIADVTVLVANPSNTQDNINVLDEGSRRDAN